MVPFSTIARTHTVHVHVYFVSEAFLINLFSQHQTVHANVYFVSEAFIIVTVIVIIVIAS